MFLSPASFSNCRSLSTTCAAAAAPPEFICRLPTRIAVYLPTHAVDVTVLVVVIITIVGILVPIVMPIIIIITRVSLRDCPLSSVCHHLGPPQGPRPQFGWS